MSGAFFETTLELWASSLRAAKARMRPTFGQERTAHAAGLSLDGLLGQGRWEADALRDVVRDDAPEVLADPGAVLVLYEAGFLKQGKSSCGVARQDAGSAGKITNGQIGVFAAYVSRHGHALSWNESPMLAGKVEEIAKALPDSAWRSPLAGEGTKEPRLHDWAHLGLAHIEANSHVGRFKRVWTRGLLIRRHIADGEPAYSTIWCPADTPIETLVAVEGQR